MSGSDQPRGAWERGDFAAALLDCRRTLVDHPSFADVRNRAGLCLAMMDDLESAASEFRSALEINPEYGEAALNLAIVLSDLGRYEEASDAFARAAAIESASARTLGPVGDRIAQTHAQLGDLYRSVQEHERAFVEYRRAIELRPTFLDIRGRLGETLVALGDLDQAREELESILARNPRMSGARLHLGIVNYRTGNVAEAREQWERCLEDEPSDLRARAYLATLVRHPNTEEEA